MKRDGYHHGNLRRALLDAALGIIEADGVAAITMSALARAAGVSSGAPYRHFKSVDAVLVALASEGWSALIAEEQALVDPQAPPLEQFRRAGIATVRFAVQRPIHFRLMFGPVGRRLDDPQLAARVAEADARTDALVEAATRSGEMGPGPAQALAAQAVIYGLARLLVDGHLSSISADDAEALAHAVTGALGEGLIPREAPPKAHQSRPLARNQSSAATTPSSGEPGA